jgi:hypothetical protein
MTISRLSPVTLVIGFAAWGGVRADAQTVDAARPSLAVLATRAASPIRLDGVLDEEAWSTAPVATGFVQSEPREGEPASEQTEVRILYDEDNLFVGVFARDSDPAGIMVNELKKDFSTQTQDIFEIIVDTFHDGRNGYQFATNPKGAKWDAQMVSEGREVNANWDAIWDVRTTMGEGGWYAEMQIPFRTLRFPASSLQTWGVNFLRRVRRRNEDSYWSPIPRIHNITRVSLAGSLDGLQGIKRGNDLRVKPYVLQAGTRVGQGKTLGDFDAGFDVKYGITSGLTWDFTVNTDFAQVEADEQQVNLTRFSLFFPEKREFFLENSGVFHFGAGEQRAGGGGGLGGRTNQVPSNVILFFSRRIGLSPSGQAIPLPGGTRLTGRAGNYSIGALNIQQTDQGSSPATNFTALRLRRDILRNSDIGVMLLNKETNGPHYNRVVGTDANFRFYDDLNFNGFVAKTFSPDGVVSGSGEDVSAQAGFDYNSRVWELRSSFTMIGERFNDEMGFVPRVDVNRTLAFAGRRFRPAAISGWMREIRPHVQFDNVERRGTGLESRYIDYHLPFTFQDGTFVETGANPTQENLFVPFTINRRRNIVIPPGEYEFNEGFLLVRTNASAPFSFNGRYGQGGFYDGYKHAYEAGGTVKVNEHFNASLSVSRNDINLPGGAFTTNLVTSRINTYFSTRMFLNALLQYNTDARQWSSNVRFNFIHRPLSDFFLVFNESRDSRTQDLIDRSVVAKVTYLLAF